MRGLRDRAREAWVEREAERASAVPEPSERQRRAAYDLGQFLGCHVDPLTVDLHEFDGTYYPVEVEVDGVRFRGSLLWGGGDARYSLAGTWKVRTTSTFRRLLRVRSATQWVPVLDLADVAEVLGAVSSNGGTNA